MDSEQILACWLEKASRAVFFTGAGVSTESGIPDFRSAAGLYATCQDSPWPPEYLLSHACLVEHPDAFFSFHRSHLIHPDARPNPAHLAAALLEKTGHISAVVTQNIDSLHQMAGSQRVYELHGSTQRNYCMGSSRHHIDLDEIPDEPLIPICPQCSSIVRPDVVLYGEALDDGVTHEAISAIDNADLLIVAGTSLNVYPAAGMVNFYRGRHMALINLDATPFDSQADLIIRRPVGEVMEKVIDYLNIRQ